MYRMIEKKQWLIVVKTVIALSCLIILVLIDYSVSNDVVKVCNIDMYWLHINQLNI